MKQIALAIVALYLFAFRLPFAGEGNIRSEQSKVSFSISHASGKVKGTFSGLTGTVRFREEDLPGSSMEASLDAGTINTNNRARDADLRKKKFFHVALFPQIRFKSTEISKSADGYQVRGNLTIKEITREVAIPFQQEKKGDETVFTGSFTVNRKDFNLGLKTFPPIGKTATVTIVAAQ